MTTSDPSGPSGQSERTIIRPRPGGRTAPRPGNRPTLPPDEGRTASGGVEAPTGRAPEQVRTPGANPLIVAAGPLLDLLGRLRTGTSEADFAELKQSVSRAIDGFEKAAAEAGAYPEQLEPAKYALSATADDIVENLPGEDRDVWTQDSMLGRYFGERTGGTRFFDDLAGAMKNPAANYDLLELQYACLALGFEGVHRGSPEGRAALQTIRDDLYQALRGVTPGGDWALSPNWKGMDLGRRTIGRQIPFWAVASVVALLLAVGFFGLRMSLADGAGALASEVLAVHPDGEIEIARASLPEPPPPPPPPPPEATDHGQLERIRAALAPEIEAGLITADYLDANFIIIRMSNELLFPSGKAEVGSDFAPLAQRIGKHFTSEAGLLRERAQQHGRVVALGHSDAEPLSATSRWGSNHELSKARADSVLNAVLPYAPPDLRTQVEGRGPDDPVCTPAGDRNCWPQNRRVELLIERTV